MSLILRWFIGIFLVLALNCAAALTTAATAQTCAPDGPGVVNCSGLIVGGINETVTGDFTLIAEGVQINRSGMTPTSLLVSGDTGIYVLSLDDTTDITTEADLGGNAASSSSVKLQTSGGGSLDVVSNAKVTLTNHMLLPDGTGDRVDAIDVQVVTGGSANISVRNGAQGVVETFGEAAYGVTSHQDGTGASVAVNEGVITTHDNYSYALFSHINNSVSIQTAHVEGEAGSTIITHGSEAIAIQARHHGQTGGDAAVISAGRIETHGVFGDAAYAQVVEATSTGSASIEIESSGEHETRGEGAYGAWAFTRGLGGAGIVNKGNVVTYGQDANALFAQARSAGNTAEVKISVSEGGTATTHGQEAHGARATHAGSGAAVIEVIDTAAIATSGATSNGAMSLSASGQASVTVEANGQVAVTGSQSAAVWVDGAAGAHVNTEGTVTSSGQHGIGIRSLSVGGSQIIIADGVVSGGWQLDIAGVGAASGLPSAGVIIDGSVSRLDNRGSIGALSDRAVFNGAAAGSTRINNWGVLTGYLQLADAAANRFTNESGATLSLRHFADTDGDGTRDIKRVSISDFGGGDVVNGAGATLQLGAVAAATAVDATGYYRPTTGAGNVPLDAGVYDLNRPGIVQAQMVDMASFGNAGVIDLRGSAIGNVLVMTSNAAAGAGGTAVYTSNGGSLLINTRFNNGVVPGGGTGSVSDVLVLDRTALGSAPTTVRIGLRDGPGNQTNDNGILVVEVRDAAGSTPGVFVLAGDYVDSGQQRIIQGAYSYGLYQHGIGADGADGNWYLRSRLRPSGGGGGGGSGGGGSGGGGGGSGDGDGGSGGGDGGAGGGDGGDAGGGDGDAGGDGPDGDPVSPYSPNLPIFESTPEILRTQVELGTLYQRVGNRFWGNDPGAAHGGVAYDDSGVWMRATGMTGTYIAQDAMISTGYGVRMAGLETGVDVLMSDSAHGRLVGGLTAHYTQMHGNSGTGSLSAHGMGMGASLTYYDASGLYLDLQGKAGAYLGDYRSSLVGSVARGAHGFSGSAGAEVGQRIALGDKWALTPQLQAIYSSVGLVPFADAYDAAVSITDGQGLRGRLGLMAEYEDSWHDENGESTRLKAYGGLNYFREFLNVTRVQASDVALHSAMAPDWVGVTLGGSMNWGDDAYSLHGEIGAKTSLHSFGQAGELKATLGFRKSW